MHNWSLNELADEMRQLSKMVMEGKSSHMNYRPELSGGFDAEDLHKKAMEDYIRRGDEGELRALGVEEKSLSSLVASDGGFLIDAVTSNQIASSLTGAASLRSVAKIVNIEASSFDVLVDHGNFSSGWAGEMQGREETDNSELARISIPLHELSAMPKSSQRLLDDAAFDVESWLAERISESFSQSESVAFIHGDGSDKPTGILHHPMVENEIWEWGFIGYVKTGVDGGFHASEPADAIVDLVYALPARYRKNAVFLMNSKTAGAVRKMKDGDGRFLWNDEQTGGEAPRLFGYPVAICEDMPDVASDAVAIAFGDFWAGYTIAERPDIRILRDPFSAKPHVLFYATKRVGGDVSDYAAIKLLQFSA